MNLDSLNADVTAAILRAEALLPDSWEAQQAFREVGALEEEIAAVVGASDIEGEIARLGAVTAALSAGEPLGAVQLAERYLADGLTGSALLKLEELLKEADAAIDALPTNPNVQPIRFTLVAA